MIWAGRAVDKEAETLVHILDQPSRALEPWASPGISLGSVSSSVKCLSPFQHQRLGISEGREHYCSGVYACTHTCALRISTELILHADSCPQGIMLFVMFYKMAGRVLLWLFSLFQFVQNSSLSPTCRQILGWGTEISTCWAENGVRGKENPGSHYLVEAQSCLMEGQKRTGSSFPVGKEATQP